MPSAVRPSPWRTEQFLNVRPAESTQLGQGKKGHPFYIRQLALGKYEAGETTKQIAQALGVGESTLRVWRRDVAAR